MTAATLGHTTFARLNTIKNTGHRLIKNVANKYPAYSNQNAFLVIAKIVVTIVANRIKNGIT
jgi:hypothetical protein